MQLFDSHCHIHEAGALAAQSDNGMHNLWLKAGETDSDALIARAAADGVTGMICVGTTLADSRLAVGFVRDRSRCWASVGIHPHEANRGEAELTGLKELLHGSGQSSIIAIGECGLDYHYTHSPKDDQISALRYQIELALVHNLPLIFHVRDALDDFWPLFDEYRHLRGVLHSFTDSQANLDKALERGLYIGLNGIMTFTKHTWQLDVAKAVPLERLLIETDAPFLTPNPYRGKINEPAYIKPIAEFIARLKQISLARLCDATTENARTLFYL